MSDARIIVCGRRDDPFSRVSKSLLNDVSLSWKAKGILAYLLGKPPEWKMRVGDLVKRGPDGKDAVRSALKELRDAGYAEFVRVREGGKFNDGVWKISDHPIYSPRTGFPDVEKPDVEKPDVDFPYISKQESSKKESSKNDVHSHKSKVEKQTKKSLHSLPLIAEVKDYAREIGLDHGAAEHFFDHYSAQGWKSGASRITDWKAKLRVWKRNWESFAKSKSTERTGPAMCVL